MVHLLFPARELILALAQPDFSLLELVLGLLDFLVAQLHLFFQFRLLVEEFLLYLQQFLFLDHLSLFVGRGHHLVIFSLYDVTENRIATQSACYERHDGNNYNTHYSLVLISIDTGHVNEKGAPAR